MFRFQGKVVCPVCDFQERKQEMTTQETVRTGKQLMEQQKRDISKTLETAENISRPTDLSGINNSIINKVQELAVSLETETDLGRVRDKMECIEQGIKILKLLRD
jgi:uncharacterized Zn finger protein (UPF0148 family)